MLVMITSFDDDDPGRSMNFPVWPNVLSGGSRDRQVSRGYCYSVALPLPTMELSVRTCRSFIFIYLQPAHMTTDTQVG